VIVGIRSEHIVDPRDAREATVGSVHGVVRLVEPLGADALVYVDADGPEIVAKVTNRHAPRMGEQIELAITADRLYVFDPRTEQALGSVG
jgi:multiple sugar transport system ATP-binding protein